MPQFGEMLCELREEKRLNQGQLADILHVSTSTISAYETGKALPTMERAIQLWLTTSGLLSISCSGDRACEVRPRCP